MPTYKIRGLDVDFPFEAYDSQLVYMEKVIQSLQQVKEKLSAEEYKKFVEFMKALKSKEMKISQVLQSIVRLFSGPETLHLLERFKDYLPAKYHSLYEQHLVTNTDKL